MAVNADLKANGWWFTSRSNQFRRVYRHLRTFGVRRGTHSLSRVFRPFGGTITVPVPGYRSPLTLRAGTTDVYSFEKIFVDGEYKHPPLREPRCLIDAGANVGCSVVFFANVYPNTKIIAVEPDRDNFELLVRNTRDYENVHAVNAALWSKSTSLVIENPSNDTDSFIVREGDGKGESAIRAVTIQELLAEAGCPGADIVKIDIESAEQEVFDNGDNAWLRDVSLVMIELHDRIKPGCSAAFYRALCDYDFVQEVAGEVVMITKDPGAPVRTRKAN